MIKTIGVLSHVKNRNSVISCLLSLFLAVLLNSCNNNKAMVKSSSDSSFLITGDVSQTFNYCGGAKPTKEILDNLKKPQVYPEKTFYVRAGSKNDLDQKIVLKFTSAIDGTFSFNLKPGMYSVILEEQLSAINIDDYKTKNQAVDENCIQEWWRKPYYILEVTDKNITNLNFTFDHKCFIKTDVPCITYTGPKPA